jgi:hypothetical protein
MPAAGGVSSTVPVSRAAISLLVLAYAAPSAADTFGAELHYVTGVADLDAEEIDTAWSVDTPTILEGKSVRVHGPGVLHGVNLRGEMLFEDDWRLGIGTRVYAISGASVASDPLPLGTRIEADSMYGSASELFVGYEIGKGPAYAYLDGVFSFSVLQVQVETWAEPYGHVGTTPFTTHAFGVGPRFGALVPIGHSLMLDLAIYQRALGGYEQTLVFIGLGFWENDRHDEFSQELKGSWRGDF